MTAGISYLQDLQQPLEELQLFNAQRAAYAANPMPPAAQRQQWLKALRDLLSAEREALIDAISQDFSHRSPDETLLAELMPSLHGIHYATATSKAGCERRAARSAWPSNLPRPKWLPAAGRGGVIVPWNYPLYLAIGPLVGALAAVTG
jgi:coniferyl-aldehyde dehydrogenase